MAERKKRRQLDHHGFSGLLFTDFIPAGIDADSVGRAANFLSPANTVPTITAEATQYPEPVERFLRPQKLTVSQTAIRPTDILMADALTPLAKLRNDQRIYRLLWELARERGDQITESVWRIRVGYAALSRILDCSARALGRAFHRLEPLHYLLRYPVAHNGTVPTTYWVRSPEACKTMLAASGCTHVRIQRGKARQLCCSWCMKQP